MIALVVSSLLSVLVWQYSKTVHQFLSEQLHRVELEHDWLHVARVLRTSLQQAGNLICEKIKKDSRVFPFNDEVITEKNFLQFEPHHLQIRYVDLIQSEIIAMTHDKKRLYVRGNENWHEQEKVAVGDCREVIINQIERVQFLKNGTQLLTLKKALPFEFHHNLRIAPYHHLHFFLRKSKDTYKLILDDGLQKNSLALFITEMQWLVDPVYSVRRLQFTFTWNNRKTLRWLEVPE